jgi:hypothetical protein
MREAPSETVDCASERITLAAPPMMEAGPGYLVQCPHCAALSKAARSRGGGGFNATQWTDGFIQGPMWSVDGSLARCWSCRGFFWIDDARNLDIEKKPTAPPIKGITKADVRDALAAEITDDPDRLVWLRTQLWWFDNHPRRMNRTRVSNPDAFRENLEALRELLDLDKPDDRIFRAEICRELGEFDRAIELLDHPFDEWQERLASRVRQLAGRESKRLETVRKA